MALLLLLAIFLSGATAQEKLINVFVRPDSTETCSGAWLQVKENISFSDLILQASPFVGTSRPYAFDSFGDFNSTSKIRPGQVLYFSSEPKDLRKEPLDNAVRIFVRKDNFTCNGVWIWIQRTATADYLIASVLKYHGPGSYRAFDRSGPVVTLHNVRGDRVLYLADTDSKPLTTTPPASTDATELVPDSSSEIPSPTQESPEEVISTSTPAQKPPIPPPASTTGAISPSILNWKKAGWGQPELFQVALLYFSRGDHAEAIYALSALVEEVNPWNCWAHMNLGSFYAYVRDDWNGAKSFHRLLACLLPCHNISDEIHHNIRSLGSGIKTALQWFESKGSRPADADNDCPNPMDAFRVTEGVLMEILVARQGTGLYQDIEGLLEAHRSILRLCLRDSANIKPKLRVTNLMAFPGLDAEIILSAAKASAAPVMSLSAPEPALRKTPLIPRSSPKLRVGYYNFRLGKHAVSHATEGMFRELDATKVELYGYSFRPLLHRENNFLIVQAFSQYFDLSNMTDATAAQLISSHELDVLLDGSYGKEPHTEYHQEILAYEPAPVQVNFMDRAGTSGTPYQPYLLADKYNLPPDLYPGGYTEKLLLHPIHFVSTSHKTVWPLVRQEEPLRREPLGLSDDRVVLANNNQQRKIDITTFSVWANILRRSPASVLWLRQEPYLVEDPRYGFAPAHPLMKESKGYGINCSRLVPFASTPDEIQYLRQLRLADVMLDTPLYNAMTIGADFLWGGVPIVTLPLESMQSRAGAASLRMGGSSETIGRSFKEYEDIAVRLANDAMHRAALRTRIDSGVEGSRLYDVHKWAEGLQDLLFLSSEVYTSGTQPHHIWLTG